MALGVILGFVNVTIAVRKLRRNGLYVSRLNLNMLAAAIRLRAKRPLLNRVGVRYSSATASGIIPVADIADDAGAGAAVTDVAASSPWYHAGADAIQNLMDFVHTNTGLPWWATIVATTVGIRLMMSPMAIPQLRASSRMAIIRPELMRTQEKFKQIAQPTQDQVQQMQMETWALFKQYDVHPFKSLKFAFLQMPVFLSFFVALRELGTRFPETKTGGALWFTDLTAADPYFLLPVLSSATFLLTMELGTEGVTLDPKMKTMFRGLGALMIPLTYTFPQGLFIYWITNSLYAICQVRTLRSNWARRLFRIPDANHPDALKLLQTNSVAQTVEIIPNRPFKVKEQHPSAA